MNARIEQIVKMICIGGGALALSASAMAAEVTGAGSTAIYPVLAQWAQTYNGKTGIQINYQSIGRVAASR